MKERPILFSAQMVRAILDGRKTVTRRPVKMPHGFWETSATGELVPIPVNCPFGKPGELLWVREAWAADAQVDAIAPRDLSQGEPIFYPADGAVRQTGCSMITQGRGRPSIHMPRWACRILLEITAVRVERLQAITWEQALDEGIGDHRPSCDRPVEPDGYPACSCGSVGYVDSFAELWNSTGGDWDTNPWVWVVEFKRVTPS